jgi:hypothetical protein
MYRIFVVITPLSRRNERLDCNRTNQYSEHPLLIHGSEKTCYCSFTVQKNQLRFIWTKVNSVLTCTNSVLTGFFLATGFLNPPVNTPCWLCTDENVYFAVRYH